MLNYYCNSQINARPIADTHYEYTEIEDVVEDTYDFRVYAVNTIGLGPASETSLPIKMAKPMGLSYIYSNLLELYKIFLNFL